MFKLNAFIVFCLLGSSIAVDLEETFRNCHPNVSGFDACIRQGLNEIRPDFKAGWPKYNVEPFDPFHSDKIVVSRGLPNLGFTLTLRNITESGWTSSKVTKFVSDLQNYKVVYTQSWPGKFLNGKYEFEGHVLGTKVVTKGKWKLDLYDFVQTTTATRRPGEKVNVQINVETCGNLSLHISNLLNGQQFLERMLDGIINSAWQPGFILTRGIVNEIVGIGFSEIFDKAFHNFPFEQIVGNDKPINNTLIK